MSIKNQIMLITYADSLGKNLTELNTVLDLYFKKAIKGIHLLPFFPSSGDRGFSPLCYDKIDSSFGTWEDMEVLSRNYILMYDFMINHISYYSEYFQDFLEKKDESEYKDMFIRYKNFWENGEPTPEQVDLIYKRKPRAPFIEANFKDGTTEKIWCTFGEDQIDINLNSEVAQAFIRDTVDFLMKHYMSVLRLDAFAYAIKKADTNCFFVEPDIWEHLEYVQNLVSKEDKAILPEIHEHYKIQLKLAEKGFWVYDFALPMLVIYTLYTADCEPIKNWLNICPRKQFTTLDTHDGIGIVDVKDLLTDEQIEQAKNALYENGANVHRIYSTEKYNNLDIYQINCTFYSALGDNDDWYLLARAIQFFTPGIPQVYYVGLLAGRNDIELLEKTKQGRDINRHYYSLEEIHQEVKRPVVQKLLKLMEFRNSCTAFEGDCKVIDFKNGKLEIEWTSGNVKALLRADCKNHEFSVFSREGNREWEQFLYT